MSTLNTNNAARPDYVRPEVVEAAVDLALIHDLLDGPQAMWASSTTYIRKWTDEDKEVYKIRRLCEPCEGLFGRTLSASVGKLFAKPPKMEFGSAEAVIRAHWDNVNGRGTKGDIAAKAFASDAIADGFACIVVDHPAPPVGVRVTAANEAALNLRPFWAFYPRASLLSWVTTTVDNLEIPVQVVFAEAVEERTHTFGTASTTLYRELFVEDGVAQWRLWRAPAEGSDVFTIDASGVFTNRTGQTRGTLPLATGYAGRVEGWFDAAPPLRDVAYANLAHWRLATELTFGRQVSAIEQPVVKGRILPGPGEEVGRVKIGWLTGINVEAEGEFAFVGPSGVGLDQLAQGKVEKEQAIAAMGLSFLSRDTRAAETAEAKRLDAAAEDSTLATAAQGIEDALNHAAELHCWYLGIEKAQAFTITINRDFELTVLSPQAVTAIAKLVESGLPVLRAVQVLIAGGVLKATDDEAEDIAAEWEAGRDAAADAKALDAERALDAAA